MMGNSTAKSQSTRNIVQWENEKRNIEHKNIPTSCSSERKSHIVLRPGIYPLLDPSTYYTTWEKTSIKWKREEGREKEIHLPFSHILFLSLFLSLPSRLLARYLDMKIVAWSKANWARHSFLTREKWQRGVKKIWSIGGQYPWEGKKREEIVARNCVHACVPLTFSNSCTLQKHTVYEYNE